MRLAILAVLVGLIFSLAQPANAQYTTLGRNPVVRGGLPGARVPAGCEVHGLPYDLRAQMQGASGEVVWATFSKNEAMVMRPLRTEGEWAVYQVLQAIRCGNPLVGHYEVKFKVPTKVTVRTQEKIVIQERVVDRPVYVFSPTVYPTAPMPQPVVQTFVNRPQANFGLNFTRVNVNHSGDRPTINLFGGQGGSSTTGPIAGGSVGAISNTNSQQQQSNLFSQNQNIIPTNVTVGTGSGNTTGSAGGTGNQTGGQPQTQGR